MNTIPSNNLLRLPRYPVVYRFYDEPCSGGFNRSDFLNDDVFKMDSNEEIALYNETIDELGRKSEAKVKYSLGFCDLLKARASLTQLKLWTDKFLLLENNNSEYQHEYTKGFTEIVKLGANDEEAELYNKLSFVFLVSFKGPLSLKDPIDNLKEVIKRKNLSKELKTKLLSEINLELAAIENNETDKFYAKAVAVAGGALGWVAILSNIDKFL